MQKLPLSEKAWMNCVVLGATGGIGSAFVRQLAERPQVATVHAVSRQPFSGAGGKVIAHIADIAVESDLKAVAEAVGGPLHRVIVATGILHREPHVRPEKDWRSIDPDAFVEVMTVNALGPALAFKHLAPLLDKQAAGVMAALSARVGSISDNQLGGWYAYRASKAALNQIIRTFSIELRRKNPNAAVVGLHPGTVETGLSAPFGGGPAKRLTPDESVGRLLAVVDGLTSDQTGRVFDWQGAEVPA